MSTDPIPPHIPSSMREDFAKWSQKQAERAREQVASASTFVDAKAKLQEALAALPAAVEVPYHLTEEGARWLQFRRVCDEKFIAKLDYSKVKARVPFDQVANWDGKAPGLCACGPTGAGKTRAAWWALRRLYVLENRSFAWFPVRRLVAEMERYDEQGCADEFYRAYDFHKILFVDDLDKINWDFESQPQALFAFLDWIYRHQKPCLFTTNKDRAWWAGKMGDAFARRLFDDACREVRFN